MAVHLMNGGLLIANLQTTQQTSWRLLVLEERIGRGKYK